MEAHADDREWYATQCEKPEILLSRFFAQKFREIISSSGDNFIVKW